MIRSVDESLGRVLDRIDELGISDRTAVLFVSDNGGLSTLPQRGFNQATSNEPLRAGKGWLHEGGIRAPLIVKWPSEGARDVFVETPAISMDLYPTLLAMAGLPRRSEQTVDGMDLSGLLRDAGARLSRDTLYWHFPHYHGSGNRPSAAIRAGNWKLVHWFEDGSHELYDLATDPSETTDQSSFHPDDADSLDRSLLRWLASIDAKLPSPMEEPAR